MSQNSSASVVVGNDTGTFAPSGHIFFDGGFCIEPPCAIVFNGLSLAANDFSVGTSTISGLTAVNNGSFSAQVDGNGSLTVLAAGAFDATALLDGVLISREAIPTHLTGTLDRVHRTLSVTGQLALDAGSGAFSVLATFDDTAPTAVIDGSGVAECGVPQTFSGARSFDEDGESLASFGWTEIFDDESSIVLGSGETISPSFQIGHSVVELRVTDAAGRMNAAALGIDASDTTPPTVTGPILLSHDCAWPPNHDYVVLRVARDLSATVTDACDPDPRLVIQSGASSQPDNGVGDGNTTADVVAFPDHICLRAERSGTDQAGRTYSIALAAVDASGNAATVNVDVIVPHDERPGTRCSIVGPLEVADTGDSVCAPDASVAPADQHPARESGPTGCGASGLALPGVLLLLIRRRRR